MKIKTPFVNIVRHSEVNKRAQYGIIRKNYAMVKAMT
jgi:hypothetical protein